MKNIYFLLALVLSCIMSSAQSGRQPYVPFRTNGNVMVKDSALAVGTLLIPAYSAPSLNNNADRWGQSFGINTTNGRFNVRGNGQWLVFPNLTEVQALANASIQSLSVSGLRGQISISGGNTIELQSLNRAPTNTYPDANILPTLSGFYPAGLAGTTSNYPFTGNGSTLKFLRDASSGSGYFEIAKSSTADDQLWFRTGSGVSTFNAWDIIAGQNWTNAQITNATNALTASNGITRSGNDFRLGGLVSNNPELIFLGGTNISMRAEQLGGRTGGFLNINNPLDGANNTVLSLGAVGSTGPGGGTTQEISFTQNLMTVRDSRNGQGLVYGGAYEANFIPESLVSKRYVDSRTSSIIELPTGQTTYTASANQIIIPHATTLTTITLPSTTVIGSLIQVIGEGGGTGNWRIAQQAGQRIVGVGISTTTGTGGTLTATDPNCTVTLRLSAPNKWTITSSQGTLTPL